MTADEYKIVAKSLMQKLPPGPGLAIIGSASFHQDKNRTLCTHLGRSLAEIPGLFIITGGVSGVGETIGRAFFSKKVLDTEETSIFHILPEGCGKVDYGTTFFAGANMYERREILGRMTNIYLVIEGGPGTAHEARVAIAQNATLIPVAASGDAALENYKMLKCPAGISMTDWRILADMQANIEKISESISEIMVALICEKS
ncbi:hypothetical protein ACFL35_04160 [Candidatus Riflebacteria bacterium]